MEESQKRRLQKILLPLLLCSVEQRYALLYTTSFGRQNISVLDLQGAAVNAIYSIFDLLQREGGVDKFLGEIEKLPRPEWYKE